jgi:hypothetical protein
MVAHLEIDNNGRYPGYEQLMSRVQMIALASSDWIPGLTLKRGR